MYSEKAKDLDSVSEEEWKPTNEEAKRWKVDLLPIQEKI
jgi:hypothetical protein